MEDVKREQGKEVECLKMADGEEELRTAMGILRGIRGGGGRSEGGLGDVKRELEKKLECLKMAKEEEGLRRIVDNLRGTDCG